MTDAAPPPSAPELELPDALAAEQRWFMRLRWAAGAVIVAGAIVGGALTGWPAQATGAVGVGLLVLLSNAVFTDRHRRAVRAGSSTALLALAWAQIVVDQAVLALLVAWSGGLASPLLGLYVVHLILAGLLLPPVTTFVAAALALGFVGLALAATDHWPRTRPEMLAALGWMLMLLVTAYLTSHVAGLLRARRRALERAGRRSAAVLNTAADGIITIDRAGIVLSVNPAAERIFGYGRDELVGGDVRRLMPAPYHGEHGSYLERYLRTGEARIIGIGREVTGRRRDGSTFPLDLSVSEVRLGEERIFTGIVRDISDRKDAEAALRQLNETLQRQQRALVQHEKMAAMGQMAAGVAHEIANPLASLDSLLQLVRRHPDRLRDDTVDRLLEQVARIHRVVEQMTDFAHPNDVARETVAVNDLVGETFDMLRFDHRLRSIEVERRLDDDAGQVLVMRSAVQQVLVNVIMNAVDAVEGAAAPRIVVATGRRGDDRLIEIVDNGPGIAAEHLERVFEPFFTTKPVGRGTGLGLSISYSLLERQGGRFEVGAAPGGGTRFAVLLPPPESAPRGQDHDATGIPDRGNDAG